jgi:hypothetical protein
MLLLSDFGPYRPNQFGREKGMIHCGHYRRDRATVDSERQFNWLGVVGLPLDSGGAAALQQST